MDENQPMQPRGRGRARAQGRGQPQQQRLGQQQQQRLGSQQQPQQRPAQQQQQQQRPVQQPQQQGAVPRQPQGAWSQQRRPPAQGAWPQGQPPQGPPPQGPPLQGPWGRPQQQPPQAQPAPQSVWAHQKPHQPEQKHQQQSETEKQAGRGDRTGAPSAVYGGEHETAQAVSGAGEGEGLERGATGRGGAGGNGVRGRTNRIPEPRTRPATLQTKLGSSGQKVEITANYFKLLQAGRWTLLQYRVDFSEEIDDTREKKFLLRTALKDDKDFNGYIFDGTVLYSPTRLPTKDRQYFVKKESSEQNVSITIRCIGDVAWGDYHYLQVFNIIIRKCLTELRLQLVGRNYFDPAAAVDMRDYNLLLWPGYFTSIKQHESDILMCAELQFKVMRTDTMYDMMNACASSPNMKKDFHEKSLGLIVLTGYNNRTYRVDDVDFSTTPSSTFSRRDGSAISYMQYYKEKYGIYIRDSDQPMLVSRSKPREIRAGMPELIYLVPELCRMTGLTDSQRDNFRLMRALADHTRVAPKQRMEKLREFSHKLLANEGAVAELKKWDLKIADTLVQFQARVLPPEQIVMGNNLRYTVGKDADWTRELRSSPAFIQNNIGKLAVICHRRIGKETDDFLNLIDKAARGMKWSIGRWRIFDIPDDKPATYVAKVEEIREENVGLIIFIVPNNNSERYGAIKKKCYVDRAIPCQVVLAKNLTAKGAMSIATKIAIQLNCKVGGAPWTVTIPLSHLMVVGYDVCRDTVNKKKSFSAMVASLDKNITRYFSFVAEHKYEEEISSHFSAFIILAVEKYYKINKVYPERILIYRDGVGDGQIPYVLDREVNLIKEQLNEKIYKGRLRMAFVIVSKRVNTRFAYQNQNPLPGTVVDDVVTLPERYDFYIVSQCVRQGTVAPTSYNIVEDTMGLPADKMQILTYKLCHMYYNWSGTVRVPAPCQYAHKLAFLTSQSLHRVTHRELEDTLYFL